MSPGRGRHSNTDDPRPGISTGEDGPTMTETEIEIDTDTPEGARTADFCGWLVCTFRRRSPLLSSELLMEARAAGYDFWFFRQAPAVARLGLRAERRVIPWDAPREATWWFLDRPDALNDVIF